MDKLYIGDERLDDGEKKINAETREIRCGRVVFRTYFLAELTIVGRSVGRWTARILCGKRARGEESFFARRHIGKASRRSLPATDRSRAIYFHIGKSPRDARPERKFGFSTFLRLRRAV